MPDSRSADAFSGVERRPGVSKPDPVLRVDSMHRAFGGVVAVDVDHLEVQRRAITALIGPNGAGKSTLFNLLTGFDSPDQGTWRFDGHYLQRRPPHRVAQLGLVRNFQLTKTLARMTVLDNVMLAASGQAGEKFLGSWWRPGWRPQERQIRDRSLELLERFTLLDKAHDRAGSLSGGQRKLLDLARALMTTPSMICLDEPMAGVNPALAQSLLRHITSLRDDGMTVLFVEHDMDVVMEISEWVVVMAQGRIVAEGPPGEIISDEAVIDAYLGEPPRRLDELEELEALGDLERHVEGAEEEPG